MSSVVGEGGRVRDATFASIGPFPPPLMHCSSFIIALIATSWAVPTLAARLSTARSTTEVGVACSGVATDPRS